MRAFFERGRILIITFAISACSAVVEHGEAAVDAGAGGSDGRYGAGDAGGIDETPTCTGLEVSGEPVPCDGVPLARRPD